MRRMTTTWQTKSSSPTRLRLSEHTLDINVRRCDVGLFDFSEVEDYVRAMTADREYLSGHIFFQHGDDSGFKAIRAEHDSKTAKSRSRAAGRARRGTR